MTSIARLATWATAAAALATAGMAAAPVLAQTAAGPAASAAPVRRGADPALVRALQDHVWTLQSATDAEGRAIDAVQVPGHPFVLRFEGARAGLRGGCNQMMGSWRLSARNQLRFGQLAGTMKACETPLMNADRQMSALLTQPLRAGVQPGDSPVLRLESASRQVLSFSGRRTPQSLYGPPTRIFLEVNAQTVPCQPGAGAPAQCLQVRERRFDDKGLRVGEPGPWQAFYSPIEGYTHEPGVRNVLRINRYERTQAPADASRYVYVLDLVVESEIVAR
jgi:heat shock protein HslJ